MQRQRTIAVLDAPSNLGLSPPAPGVEPGVKHLPNALRSNGLVARLHADDAGQVTPPAYIPERDAETGLRNGTSIARYSTQLADRVESLLEQSYFPLVLGGDCSVLLGCMLALKRLGRYGLTFIDGHLDFRHPGYDQPVGAVAGEDLAFLTGRGTPVLANLEGRQPLVLEEDVVSIGSREFEGTDFGVYETGITHIKANDIRRVGARRAAENALAILSSAPIDGYWMHIDADVLDESIMPAVDTSEPDGLTFQELEDILNVLAGSEKVTGAVVTIFDPTLDQDGSLATAFADAIVNGFARTQVAGAEAPG